MDRHDRDRILATLTREQLVAAIRRIHDALYLDFVDKGPAGEGFEYREGKAWTQDTIEEVADAVNDLPGLRPL